MPDPSQSNAGASAPSVSALERRVFVRYACQLETLCGPVDDAEVMVPALVRDVSQGGIGIILRRPLEPGKAMFVQVPCGLQQEPKPVRVVHATALADGNWIVGCQFLNPLTELELQALLQRF